MKEPCPIPPINAKIGGKSNGDEKKIANFATAITKAKNNGMNTSTIARGMRGIVLLLAATLTAGTFTAEAESTFGIKAGYITRNNSSLAGLVFTQTLGSHIRLAPQIGVVLRNSDRDALIVDADVHFPFSFAPKLKAYPLVGLAFNSWSRHETDYTDRGKDVNHHTNSLGLNAGGGIDFYCSQTLKLGLECRYTLIKHNPNGQFSVSIAYVF